MIMADAAGSVPCGQVRVGIRIELYNGPICAGVGGLCGDKLEVKHRPLGGVLVALWSAGKLAQSLLISLPSPSTPRQPK